ncbi:hypothetical protein LOTGIDRAFT_182066 [Lottia gigantea]|uniref:PIH1D1/2/3 CS-like domain-containing protein n=1 Tax=Lottia gigantea TaxID=225164 RepID=V4AJD4_LOTGI|nr:hypothetical protein LOTGIDRAFT_182066 [Lottia gigantea]ESO93666.1 hypothetical protein LOTGIDRAFT_182066 [Lottia gigantea]
MDLSSASSLNALCNLLKPENEDSDSDEDQPSTTLGKLGPGHIGELTKPPSTTDKKKATNPDSKNIWDEEEIPEGSEFESTFDPCPQPEFDIMYKQAVTSEDIFLQMGNKTNATSSCEAMVIKIQLPGTKMADVDLDVKPKYLDCRSPKYKLGLHLPHPVDDKSGKAEWDKKLEILKVTLTMKREYDFVNM